MEFLGFYNKVSMFNNALYTEEMYSFYGVSFSFILLWQQLEENWGQLLDLKNIP